MTMGHQGAVIYDSEGKEAATPFREAVVQDDRNEIIIFPLSCSLASDMSTFKLST